MIRSLTVFTRLLCPVLLVSVAACGGAGGGRASVSPASMPPGGSFTGVWFSPQYGEMHMRQSGNAVIGEYSKDERVGRIQGNVIGNLMRFSWTEERELVQGRPSLNRGRGYFQLKFDGNGRENIIGEWGIDDSEIGGGPWNGYKMKNRQPNLSTDSTGSSGAPVESGPDWGDSGGTSGEAAGGSSDDADGSGLPE